MTFQIPQPILVLAQPLQVMPSRSFNEPREGKLIIPVEIDWQVPAQTFQINVQGIAQQSFSQIIMLDVDNSQSGADVTFFFTDTTDTLVVPAYSGGLFPVFTSQLSLYCAAPAALATDVTRFRILNYLQSPSSNPAPQFHTVATALAMSAAGTFPILGPGVSGTLAGYSANVTLVGGAGVGSWTGTLKDHTTGAILDQGSSIVGNAQNLSSIVLNVDNTAIRFGGGLDFVVTNAGVAFGSQAANASIRYRTP